VNWTNHIPSRWEVRPLRRILRGIEQGWSPVAEDRLADDDEWAVIKLSAVADGRFKPAEHKALAAGTEPDRRFEIRDGDFLLTRANTPELVGAACVVRHAPPQLMLCDLVYRLQFDTAAIFLPFMSYWMRSQPGRAQIEADARGSSQSMVKIGQGHIRSWISPVPPVVEQRAIADFLDRKTAAIDALIGKKERLAALALEKRHATVWNAITKGVAADAALRESGHRWIGPFPAHWDVARTRQVARLESGHTPSRQHPDYWIPEECTVPWVSLADVWQLREGTTEIIRETTEKVSPVGIANSAARLLPAGTIVVSRTASVGFSGIIAEPMATTQDFVNFTCGPKIRPLYLLYVFRAMRDEFRSLTMGSTHQTIYMPDVARFVTPVPPLDEQDAIVEHIRETLRKVDSAAGALTAQIDALREYRQALITAAVTGQLDLGARGAA
jgi:type I restriction enzyme, S subunit